MRANRINDAQIPTTDFRRGFAAVNNRLAGDGGAAEVGLGTGVGAALPIFPPRSEILFGDGFE